MSLEPGAGSALEAHGLGKRYGGRVWALRSVDLAVPVASITALVGPNGAGKSTLMKAWVGFERPTEGSVPLREIEFRESLVLVAASLVCIALAAAVVERRRPYL